MSITLVEEERVPGPRETEYLDGVTIHTADCRDAMRAMEENSIDTIITDGPYGLGFMGKEWDHGIPGVEFWREALRVAKPGAMLFAFGGTRTFHRLACAIEDAGWEIRDTMGWLHGQGFPKSHNVAGAIDRKLGHGDRGHRVAVAGRHHPDGTLEPNGEELPAYEARSEEAGPWTGYGTALKPAWEPICVAMKPIDGTFANNALKWGVAGLWIDGGRVDTQGEEVVRVGEMNDIRGGQFANSSGKKRTDLGVMTQATPKGGRWPANILHDGSPEALSVFPEVESGRPAGVKTGGQGTVFGHFNRGIPVTGFGDSGSAARFFYCAKASSEERSEGMTGPEREAGIKNSSGRGFSEGSPYAKVMRRNNHPTVKPLSIMRYLVRLAKMPHRPGYRQKVLDLFAGSGTTGVACVWEDVDAVLIEKEPEHVEIIKARCAHAIRTKALQPELFTERGETTKETANQQVELF